MDIISKSLGIRPLDEKTLEYIYADPPNKTENAQKGKMNAFYGKTHTQESKEKMSKSAKKRGSNRLGKKHSEKTKELIRKKALGRPSARKGVEPWNKGIKTSDATKMKISKANKGNTHTSESIMLISEAAKNRKRVLCNSCGKEFDVSNYTRWHGEKCKHGKLLSGKIQTQKS